MVETGECGYEPVDEGTEDKEEEEFKPAHIVAAHTLPDKDAVVVVIIYTHVAHVTVLCLWLGGDRAFVAEVPEGLTIRLAT